ncbi:ABC transporter substrate-binding protein [Falsiroseomonas sp. HW251]|uniref:ABC transporter substrate-binding protein n=1 Tax=Falsiroseomonas sp. HW251 TaxID=3390998 RepID=UPI003D31A9CA
MTRIVLQEPFRAIFYTPFYAALARGDFAAQGLAVGTRIVGPDEAAANLLSGAADLAWSGPMRVIRDHGADAESPLVSFGAVVMGDPFLILGRAPCPGFRIADLAGMTLGVVSEVPTPWWCLQQDLRCAGIDPAGVKAVTGCGMAENMRAMLAGEIDAVQLFEPFVTLAEAQGASIWHAQAARGATSYTTFFTTRTTLAAKRDAMRGMLRGIAAMQAWLHAATAAEIAATVAPCFPDLDRAVLETAIARYRGLGIWSRTPHFPAGAFETLAESIHGCGAIARRPSFLECTDTAIEAEALG